MLPPCPVGILGMAEPTSGGNMEARSHRTARHLPGSRRSILLRNWRTLPGQSWLCRMARASGPISRFGNPVVEEINSKIPRSGQECPPAVQRARAQRSAQRRPMIQILAETAGGYFLSDIPGREAMTRTSTCTLVNLPDAGSSGPQRTRRMRFCVSRHIRHLIDEERAAMGLFQSARLAGKGLCSFLPKQLIFHGLWCNGRGIDHHKGAEARCDSAWSAGPRHFLAGARAPKSMIPLLALATFSIVWRSWLMAGERPVRRAVCPEICRSSRTSRSAGVGFPVPRSAMSRGGQT